MDIIEKIEKISAEECKQLKRLPYDLLIGHCAYVFDKAGVPHVNPIPEEYFDAVISGICDEIYDGCEPEFETEEEYNKFEEAISNLKKCEYMVEEYEYNDFWRENFRITSPSPYRDKTIPFLGIRKNKK